MHSKNPGHQMSDFITNEEVRTRAKQRPVSSIMCQRRLSWLGHVARLLPERLANRVLQWNPQGQTEAEGTTKDELAPDDRQGPPDGEQAMERRIEGGC